jgi:hypothetical protein
MRVRMYGLLSAVAAGIAIALAVLAGLTQAAWLGLAYGAFALVALLVVVAVFCTKCLYRDRCGHVIFGPIARLLAKEPRRGDYTSTELAVTSLGLILIFAVPQLWLWRTPLVLTGFWLLLLAASAGVRVRLCPSCGNRNCPLARAES